VVYCIYYEGRGFTLDYTNNFTDLLTNVSSACGKPISTNNFKIVDLGLPHKKPDKFPTGKMVVYCFIYNNTFLKIGLVTKGSKDRYTSHHYNPLSSPSNLANSILSDIDMDLKVHNIEEDKISQWIQENCHRIEIWLDDSLGINALNFVEKLIQYCHPPKYEGR